jgi:mannosyltransferase
MRTLAADGVGEDTPPEGDDHPMRMPSWVVPVALGLAVLGGVVLRFVQRSPLWLDEALSVNIAVLPAGDLLDALRHDGHPPLYYLLLHGWMQIVGEGDLAVRSLSAIFGLAALPLMWIAGGRLAGRSGARWALAIGALSPFLVRYSTEARMYSLVMLLVLAGYLLLTDTLAAPRIARLIGVAVVSGLLLLTQYWSFYLLASVGLLLVLQYWRVPGHRPAILRAMAAVVAGGLLFLPWLGGFLYQSANTGTPWGQPYRPTAIVQATLGDLGGGGLPESALFGTVTMVLALLALFAVRSSRAQVVLDLRTAPTVRCELAVVALTLGLGAVVGYITSATFQSRYAAVFAPLLLLAVAVGITRLPGAARLVAGGTWVVLALGGLGWINYFQRTQAGEVAAEIAARANPGDVVVYCPDQLGPAYSREMPGGLVEMAYPTLGAPERVDWVDYAERNAAADPDQIAGEVRSRAAGKAIFVVWMSGYRTFDEQCEDLLTALGPAESLVVQKSTRFYEPAFVHWWPAPDTAPSD